MTTKLVDTPWAIDILAEGADKLDKLGLRWWLSAGTMLGIHRDGALIPYDTDLDVGVKEPADHELIKSEFSDFELVAEGMHQLAFKKDEVLFDIYFYTLNIDAGTIECHIHGLGTIIKPCHLFERLGEVEFEGRRYPTPNPVEEYLINRYGADWMTPKTEKTSWTEEAANLVK